MDKIIAEILEQGHNEYSKSRYENALSIYQKAEKKEPGNPSAMGYIGLAYMSLGQFEQARHYLRYAYESDNDGAKFLAQMHLGILDYKEKQYNSAIELLSMFRDEISHFDTIKDDIKPGSADERMINRFATSCYWLGLADYEEKNYFNAIRDMHLYKSYSRASTTNIQADIVTIKSYAIRFEVDEAEEHLNTNIQRIRTETRHDFKIGEMYDELSTAFEALEKPKKAHYYANEAFNSFIAVVSANGADITQAKEKLAALTIRLGYGD